jgi:hypothetical protein
VVSWQSSDRRSMLNGAQAWWIAAKTAAAMTIFRGITHMAEPIANDEAGDFRPVVIETPVLTSQMKGISR